MEAYIGHIIGALGLLYGVAKHVETRNLRKLVTDKAEHEAIKRRSANILISRVTVPSNTKRGYSEKFRVQNTGEATACEVTLRLKGEDVPLGGGEVANLFPVDLEPQGCVDLMSLVHSTSPRKFDVEATWNDARGFQSKTITVTL